jgi:hypothetical protein
MSGEGVAGPGTTFSADGPDETDGSQPSEGRRAVLAAQVGRLVQALRQDDEATFEAALLRLSQSRRWLAPLALVVGAFAMLFDGLKLLVSNGRLTLVELLPAMWLWAAMLDLKVHALHGKSTNVLRGPVLTPLVLAIMAITAAAFFLNAVFAFAIAKPGTPKIRPAFAEARSHLAVIFTSGAVVGLLLGLSTVVVARWGRWWFTVSLSVVVAVMMVGYVAVPSRLIGMKTTHSKRDKLTATALGSALGTVVSMPSYLLGRIGILMLGSHVLLIPGILVIAIGVCLHAGMTSAIKAIKMSAKLVAGNRPTVADPPPQGNDDAT